MFLKSLLPDLKSLPRPQKMSAKIQFQEILYNELMNIKPTTSTSFSYTSTPTAAVSTQSSNSVEDNSHWQSWQNPNFAESYQFVSQIEPHQKSDTSKIYENI